MKITEIKESGCNNTLLWAISNGADIKSDFPLQSIINDELFYLVTIEGINMLELFRLTQTYRDKLRIVYEHKAEVPSMDELTTKFPGTFTSEGDDSSPSKLADAAEFVISNLINIALQMQSDSDIITPEAVRLYLPMISRNYDVQIPVSFMDFVGALSEKSAPKLFTAEYPANLQSTIENNGTDVMIMLQMLFVKQTSIIRHHQRYDKYLDRIKYAPLSKCKNDKLYKIYLSAFHRFDPIGKHEVRCSMFNPNQNAIMSALRQLKYIKAPLEIDFVVQLPIQMMQLVENRFGPDMLTISYECSMASILNEGLVYNDFVASETLDGDPETSRPEEQLNAISEYKVRLIEANQLTMNTINAALKSKEDIDVTGVFALLPSMYMTKAIISVNVDKIPALIDGVHNTTLENMLEDISQMAENILSDIEKSTK